jgi:hypothetical protein
MKLRWVFSVALLHFVVSSCASFAQARVPAGYWERLGLKTGGDFTAKRQIDLTLIDGKYVGKVTLNTVSKDYILFDRVGTTNAVPLKIYRMKLPAEINRQYPPPPPVERAGQNTSLIEQKRKEILQREAQRRHASSASQALTAQTDTRLADEEKKKRLAEFDDAVRKERLALYETNPPQYFGRYIAGKYVIESDGSWQHPREISGKILQIPDDRTVLLQVAMGDIDVIAVEGYDTTKWVDNLNIDLAIHPAGTYRYTSVMGSIKTVPLYKEPRWVRLADFDKRRKVENIADL